MIEKPGLELSAVPAHDWHAEGPLAGRAVGVARAVAARLESEGFRPRPLRLSIRSAPPEHVGLGTGTQLGLAVARCVAAAAGLEETSATRLAPLAGRGLRSGVGLHGFDQGGLIVDGGHRPGTDEAVPPLICRHAFPSDWSVLVVIRPLPDGLHGAEELKAFAALPPFSTRLIGRLSQIVLLGLLPALVESDLFAFGAAVEELQHHVGMAFAPAQGGMYAHHSLAPMVTWLRGQGLQGVGQSSWGPTLYGFLQADAGRCEAVLRDLCHTFALPPTSAFWTTADNKGASIRLDQPNVIQVGPGDENP